MRRSPLLLLALLAVLPRPGAGQGVSAIFTRLREVEERLATADQARAAEIARLRSQLDSIRAGAPPPATAPQLPQDSIGARLARLDAEIGALRRAGASEATAPRVDSLFLAVSRLVDIVESLPAAPAAEVIRDAGPAPAGASPQPWSAPFVLGGFQQVRLTRTTAAGRAPTHSFDIVLANLNVSGTVLDPRNRYFVQLRASTLGNSGATSVDLWWMERELSSSTSLRAGRLLLPYSRQFQTHPGKLLFADISEADYAFNLPKAVGVGLARQVGRVDLHLAATNGVRALDGAGQQNRGEALGALGRAEFALLGPYGYLESAPGTPSGPRLSFGVAAAWNPVQEASAFQNVLPGDRTLNATADLGLRVGGFSLQGALYARHNDAGGGDEPRLEEEGYYAQAGLFVVPSRWELAARVSGVDFDRAHNPAVPGDTRTLTLGLNGYLRGHNAKIQVDLGWIQRTLFQGGREPAFRVRAQSQVLF